MQTLKERAKLDVESTALGVRCLQAQAEVMELKGKVDNLGTTTSATLGPYSYSALGGIGSGLTAQASPQLGRGMSGLGLPQLPTPPPPLTGRGLSACTWHDPAQDWLALPLYLPLGQDQN